MPLGYFDPAVSWNNVGYITSSLFREEKVFQEEKGQAL
jgi:hypothetical protein